MKDINGDIMDAIAGSAPEEREGIVALIEAHRKHLQVLQLQAAALGMAVPAHITTEIARYEREITRLVQDAQLSPTADVIKALGDTGMYQLMYAHIMRIDGDMWRISEDVRRIQDMINKLLIAVAGRALGEMTRTQGERL